MEIIIVKAIYHTKFTVSIEEINKITYIDHNIFF